MSKGSKRRPQIIPDEEMQHNWDVIFNSDLTKSEVEESVNHIEDLDEDDANSDN